MADTTDFTIAAIVVMLSLHFWGGGIVGPVVDRIQEQATIAEQSVPSNLHCQEDEVIGFIGIDKLGCINVEEVQW